MPQNIDSTTNFRKNPAWFNLLNRTWQGMYPLGTKIRLDKDDIIARARKQTRLRDLGRDFNDEPFVKLLGSIEQEARLHPVGRFITRERFVSLLAIRLRAEDHFRRYPAILEQELYPAWVIVGLQRTGTTKLQRLLAEDPDHRVIPSWEVINPVPVQPNLYDLSITTRSQGTRGNEDEKGDTHPFTRSPVHPFPYPDPRDKRLSIANTSIRAVKLISPGFFAVHPIDAMQPEEDILLLDVSFMSTTPEAMMHVPSYASWLEGADQSAAYEYGVKLLKFLQWIRPAKRWVLKSPHHLEFPGIIEKYFPDVKFLWPHRTPAETIPSFLSMVTYNRMIFSSDVTVDQVAGHWVRKIGYMLDRALEYRQQPGNDAKFTDIHYKNLVMDSLVELEKVYRLDGGLTPGLAERFRRHELENPHRKHGVHTYSMADFGLTEAEIDRHTGHYRQFFKELYG